jgi:cyclopropane fatty-acyl-phospholipid synthase-like methyltransferase
MYTFYTPEAVGQYYDNLGTFYKVVWEDSVHFGYWYDPTDTNITMAQAQIAFTDLMIKKIAATPGQRVLDVGCGTGRPGLQLAEKTGAHVVGITVSQSQAAAANEAAQASEARDRAKFEVINAMEMPFEEGSFDAAWAFESFFHMPSRPHVLGEIVRSVRPGGRIVIADFVRTRDLTQEEIDITYPAFAVNDIGSYAEYITEMKEAGIEIEECLDVTLNTIHPSNLATFAAMANPEKQAELRAAYGDEMVDGLINGWSNIQKANETLTYIVITGIRK